MNIKQPPIYDVSHWKEISDFSVVSPRPALFITKATEGTTIVDVKFPRFFTNAAAVGWRRGAYHFHRKARTPRLQAKWFGEYIYKHITDKDYLILDVEEGGETAAQLWAFLECVREDFPRNQRIIYGRKNLLDPIPMTVAERAYFKQIPIWTAGYPWFPDLYNAVPSGYVPDQTKFGKVWLWQYSEKGTVTGIQGSVDLNMATPEFLPILYSGDVEPTPIPQPPTENGETMQFQFKVITNERTGPGTNYPLTGKVYGLEEIVNIVATEDNSAGERWGQIAQNKWAALIYNGIIRAVPVFPPPPPAGSLSLKLDINTELTLTDEDTGRRYGYTLRVENAEFVELP